MSEVNRKLLLLRDEAWQAVINTMEYKEFLLLDGVVKQLPVNQGSDAKWATNHNQIRFFDSKVNSVFKPVKRVTQIDVAASVLKRAGEPLNINEWLARCIKAGIDIKGDDPLPNFRSTVSRSNRFYNFTHDRVFYWWFVGVDLPESWRKVLEPELLIPPVTLDHHSQSGSETDASVT